MRPKLAGLRWGVVRSFRHEIGKTAVIYPAAFLMATGIVTLAVGLVFYLREVLGASGAQIGAFFALWSFAYVLACLLIRPFTDSIQPRYLLVTATSLMFIFAAGLCVCRSLTLAFVLYSLVGLSTSILWPPLMGWLSGDAEGAELNLAMSRFNLAWSLGAIVGPLLGGWLSQQAPALPLVVASSMFLFTTVMATGAILALPRVREDSRAHAQVQQAPRGEDKSTPLRFPAWVGLYTAFVVSGAVMCIFPVSAREDLHLSKGLIGMMLFCRTLLMTIAFVALGRTIFWHFSRPVLLLGQIVLGLLVTAMIFVTHPVLLAALLGLIGLFVGLSYTNSLFHGAAGSTNRTARMALHEALLSVGLITGSLVGGLIYQWRSMAWVCGFCAAIVLVGVAAQAALSWRAEARG